MICILSYICITNLWSDGGPVAAEGEPGFEGDVEAALDCALNKIFVT